MAQHRKASVVASPVNRGHVLEAEGGDYRLIGNAVSFDVRIFAARLRELTSEAIARRGTFGAGELEVIDRRKRELDAAFAELRDLGERVAGLSGYEEATLCSIAADMGRAVDSAVAAALALGFHHKGGPEAVEEAEAAGRGQGPAKARADKAGTTKGKIASKARELLKPLAFAIWDADPDLLRHPQQTAAKVFDHFAREIVVHVPLGSIWMPPGRNDTAAADSYLRRMMNPIRTLRTEYKTERLAV